MVQRYRDLYNAEFTFEKYEEVKKKLTENAGVPAGFRISESPIFLTKDFQNKLSEACSAIIGQIKNMPREELEKAIPAGCNVPNDTEKPDFLIIDFGICRDENNEIVPQLIELQAFPSLYAFQEEYELVINQVFPFTEEIKTSVPKEEYISKLREIIIGKENPENVVLLEIFPERQKTQIDFALTEKYLAIKTVCLTKVKKEGKKLYYLGDSGERIEIRRIYNRIIFDELDRIPDLKTEFNFREEVDVQWVTHPNWFFKISKYILPKLNHRYVPKSYFLKDFPQGENLADFVLKPLFSFAGSGVDLHPTLEKISEITDPENFILQRKVYYEPLFKDINGQFSKAEIRLLFIWKDGEENPLLMDNLVRMTKSDMAGVDFNKKDAIWIGSSIAFFEK